MNKVLHVMFLALALLLVTAGATSADITPVDAEFRTVMPAGELVQGFALLDGSAAYLSTWQNEHEAIYIGMTTISADGEPDQAYFAMQGAASAMQISACGNFVHVFVETPDSIEYFRFRVEIPLAACHDYPLYLPGVIMGGYDEGL